MGGEGVGREGGAGVEDRRQGKVSGGSRDVEKRFVRRRRGADHPQLAGLWYATRSSTDSWPLVCVQREMSLLLMKGSLEDADSGCQPAPG